MFSIGSSKTNMLPLQGIVYWYIVVLPVMSDYSLELLEPIQYTPTWHDATFHLWPYSSHRGRLDLGPHQAIRLDSL